MNKKVLVLVMSAVFLALLHPAEAQQAKIHRVGVILQGGTFYEVLDGLRDGLRELGVVEGKDLVLEIRDTQGDLKAVEEAARSLERHQVDLIFTAATSVTVAAKRATATTPIVFCAGTDPSSIGLVESWPRPGGRLTGVYLRITELTGKRLEILREILPRLRRVVTFYDPGNPSAQESAKEGREAARLLGLEFIERHVASVERLQAALRVLRAREADAYVAVSDAMVDNQGPLLIDTANTKKLPTMFYAEGFVRKGGLASYGADFHKAGRLAAKHVQRILAGTNPKDLPVEGTDRVALAVNLKTAKQLGLKIPQIVLFRADRVIE